MVQHPVTELPITVLGVVTHQSDTLLGAMVGRQLPFFALCLPFYVMGIYGGMRSVRALWPVLLVAAGSFAVAPVRHLQLHQLHSD
jgi:lactate permease